MKSANRIEAASSRKDAAQSPDTPAWFEMVFEEQYPRVYRLVYHLVGDPDEAEDLAAEAFWRLWQNRRREPDNPAAWLYRVSLNLGYNALRGRRRRETYELQASRQEMDLASGPPEDPAQAAEDRSRNAWVLSALARLPKRDAQLLVLRSSGFSYSEIASALRINPKSIGRLLLRAREKLARQFEGEEHETHFR
jgi:RNA polymerase sigma-70 factor (ECF subfamily)